MSKYSLIGATLAMSILIGCQSIKEVQDYQTGLQLINSKGYPQAIGILMDLGDYKDSRELVSKLRYIVNGDYIGAGNSQIAAIKKDGTIIQ